MASVFQFIGKTVQNGDNPNARGKVMVETGVMIDRRKTYLTIELAKDRQVHVCVFSIPVSPGVYQKAIGKGFIKIVE